VLRVNSIFPHNLGKWAQKNNVQAFHITTDCVYSGIKGSYMERDYFDANDVYGMSKNGGDTHECMTLRTSIIGEEQGQARSLLSWAQSQKGKEVSGFTNHIWNGVTTLHLAEIMGDIIEKNIYQPGVFHLHSPNKVTKFELLQILNEVYELELKIKAVTAAESCDRSLASVHPLARNLATKTIAQQVQEMRKFFHS